MTILSGLRQRHAIGPRSHAIHHTVDIGKYTMIPLLAEIAPDRILSA